MHSRVRWAVVQQRCQLVANNEGKDKFQVLDDNMKAALERYSRAFNNLTGGAFTKGYREATDSDRIAEWEHMAPAQIDQLRTIKGDEWVYKYQAEITKLKGVTSNE